MTRESSLSISVEHITEHVRDKNTETQALRTLELSGLCPTGECDSRIATILDFFNSEAHHCSEIGCAPASVAKTAWTQTRSYV